MKNNKISFIVVILTLNLIMLACRSALDAEGYLCEFTGGEWTLDDSLRNYYCKRDKPVEYPDEDEIIETYEDLTPDQTQTEEEPSDVEVFEGKTTLDSIFSQAYDSGSTIDNRITFRKSEDGAISGSLSYIFDLGRSDAQTWEESPGGALHSCSTEVMFVIAGKITGTLTEESKMMQLELTQVEHISRFDCPSGDEKLDETSTFDVPLTIIGNIISGSIPGYFSFEASKLP